MSISTQLGPVGSVEVPQGIISYREVGRGEPIVFVHGLLVNGDLWRKVVPALATLHRCITPDWPLGSHTGPMSPSADLSTPGLARLVADFLEALDLNDVTLVGNDTGGAICQLVIADHPDRIRRVVLTSCDAFDVYPPRPFGFLRLVPAVPGAAFVLAQTLRVRVLRRLPIAYGRLVHSQPERAISDSYADPIRHRAIRRDTKKVLKGISTTHTMGASARFVDFNKPALIAWPGDDRLFPIRLAERLADTLPQSTRVTIAGSRTFISEDKPEELADAIASFIAETPLQSRDTRPA